MNRGPSRRTRSSRPYRDRAGGWSPGQARKAWDLLDHAGPSIPGRHRQCELARHRGPERQHQPTRPIEAPGRSGRQQLQIRYRDRSAVRGLCGLRQLAGPARCPASGTVADAVRRCGGPLQSRQADPFEFRFASRSGRSSLTATIPLSDTSMARHTSPIPPVAIGAVSRYRLSSTSPEHNTSKLSPSVLDPRGHPHPVPAASSSLGSGESSVSERGVEQTYSPWRSYRVRVARPAAAGAGAAGHLVERGEAVPQELAAHRLVAADPVSDW